MKKIIPQLKALLNQQGAGGKKYLTNTTWVFAERVFLLGTSFIVGIYVARFLGPTQFGTLAYALSFAQLFAAFSNMGLDRILVREIVNQPEKRDRILTTSFLLKLGGALLAVATVASVTATLGNEPQVILFIVIITSGNILQAFSVLDSYFQSQVQAKYVAIARFWASLLATATKLILVLLQAPLMAFVIVYGVEMSLFGLGLLLQYFRVHKTLWRWTPRWDLARSLLRDSWPLILGGFMIDFYSRIDRIMINEMLSATETGEYAVGLKLFETISFFPVVLCTSLFPAILNARKHDLAKYQARMQQLYTLMSTSAWVVALGLALTASWLIPFLYGEEYQAGVAVLQIVAFTLVPISMGLALSQYLIAENLVKIDMMRKIVGMVANVSLNFYMIPRMGILGAAWATLISHVLTDILIIGFTPARGKLSLIFRAISGLSIPAMFNSVKERK